MKRISVLCPVLLIFCTVFFSCQKDGIEHNLQPLKNKSSLEELKSYYQHEMSAAAVSSGGAGLVGPAIEEPEWQSALFSAEKNAYLIPVRIRASRTNRDLLVSRYLVITETNLKKSGFYYYAIADMKTSKPIFPQEVLNSLHSFDDGAREITKTGHTFVKVPLLQNELFLKEIDKNDRRSGKFIAQKKSSGTRLPDGSVVSNFAPIEGCEDTGGTMVTIDWYYQVYVNGQLVSETYVYSTTQCMGGSGSGGGETGGGSGESTSCDSKLNSLISSVMPCSDLISTTTLFEKPTFRSKRYEWRILKNIGWYIISYELGTHYKDVNTGTWKWQSLEHLNIISGGNIPELIIEPTVVRASPVIGVYTASMELGLDVKYSTVCTGIEVSATFSYTTRKTFSIPHTVTPEL